MIIIDFTEAKLRHMINNFMKLDDEYGKWAMSEILEMYLQKEIWISWKDGFPVPEVRLEG
tara:strand:- start:17201 stop:17380 length:180 start_codon:yes stop_codon:yes gene_type:complete